MAGEAVLLISTVYLATILRENGGMGKKGRAVSPFRLLVKLRVENEAYFNSLWAVIFLRSSRKELVSILDYHLQYTASNGKGEECKRIFQKLSLLWALHFHPLFIASVYFLLINSIISKLPTFEISVGRTYLVFAIILEEAFFLFWFWM